MRRAALACILIVLSLALAATAAEPKPRFITPGSRAATIDLKTMLEKGLKARRPEEFQFIARVVALVELKVLPISLVQLTYQWARRIPRAPEPDFEKALRVRAARLGIEI